MSASSNREYFFQTTASITDNERKQRKSANTYGLPLKFPTKLLALEVIDAFDSNGDVVFVAEAGGTVSALKLSTNQVTRVGTGSGAPLTSLAYGTAKADQTSPFLSLDIFAGCWDKSIVKYNFQVAPRAEADRHINSQNVFSAHQDFVKCLLVVTMHDKKQILVSGGADGELNFWTLEGRRLATLRPNCRAIESIALDPLSPPDKPIIFFSTSQREIFQVALPESHDFTMRDLSVSEPIIAHDTSVYKLYFDDDGDLWTASADKTAKHLVRDRHWAADTTLAHPDFVRDVIVHHQTQIVVTACRDEEVRVWNASTSELVHVFSGHYEEVTGLAITGNLLLSISIDATLRRWSLAQADLQKEIDKARNPDLTADHPEPSVDMSMLTEEEEAELKALMEEEEAEDLEKMATDLQ